MQSRDFEVLQLQQELRKIIHIDMDAFYASIEIRDNPRLKGLPVVVGGNPNSRAVVCAASYEARKYGIRSAMPCSHALRRCPEAIFLFPRIDRYREVSQQIHEIFREFTGAIEPLSLDEAWMDVTVNRINSPSATWVAEKIREMVFQETGLTCSAGVSYNKFLAKIASDERKPNGIFVIPPEKAASFLSQLPVGKLPGVGKVTEKRLEELDIRRGYELVQCSEAFLVQHFGKFGYSLYRSIRGIDNRPVISKYERKSVGIENTFPTDLPFGEILLDELKKLVKGLLKRLEKREKQGKTVTLKVKFSDFQQVTRSYTTESASLTEEQISQISFLKLFELCQREFPGRTLRLLGLSISNIKTGGEQLLENQQLDFYSFLPEPLGRLPPQRASYLPSVIPFSPQAEIPSWQIRN